MKTDFHFHKDRFIIFDDMISLNRRRLKTIKLDNRDNSLLLYRRPRRYKIIIYHFFKNVDDIE